jgi:pimeloyl-ACP methyl ester carboxylesterase
MKKQLIIQACVVIMSIWSSLYAQSDPITRVETFGSGHPMLLIHGMSCSAAVWEDVIKNYQDQYEFHVVHINGFGNKANVDGPVLSKVKDELIQYILDKKLKDAYIMGHSMGAFLGFWIASEAPSLVGSLIAVDGLPYFPVLQMPGITAETAKEFVDQMMAMQEQQTESMRRTMSKMIVASMISNEAQRESVVEMGMASNPSVTNRAYGELYTTDLRTIVHKIDCPVLLLGSWAGYKQYGATEEGTMTAYKAQVQDIKNVQVKMAPKGYHFLFYDEPEWFFDQVDHFVSQIFN